MEDSNTLSCGLLQDFSARSLLIQREGQYERHSCQLVLLVGMPWVDFAAFSVRVGFIFYVNMGMFPSRYCLDEEPDCSMASGLPCSAEWSQFVMEKRSQQTA